MANDMSEAPQELPKANKKQPDPDILYEGKKITLPDTPHKMPLPEVIDVLQRKLEDEQTVLDVHEVIEHHPNDALVAFNWAMKETYGWASPQPQMTFFGPIQPDLVTVQTGPKPDQFLQLPCGDFKLPNVSEPISLKRDFRRNCMHVIGQVRKGDKDVVIDLVNKARERLKTHSIFQGQAVRLPCDDDGNPEFINVAFIDTDHVNREELVLNDDEMDQVQASLWTPIQFTERCERHRIPLNRGVLLEGTYGTGKTMTASVTSKVCVENHWTYIILDDVRALKQTLLFAKRYEPCVIFAEDIDRVASNRDQRGNDILNTIDGILSKNSKIITVLTTNHVDRLEQAMLRPGRLDAVVSIRPPQEEAVKRLIHLYGANLVDRDDPLERCAEVLAGNIPATIREVVERSKLSMIWNNRDAVTDEDLLNAANGMQGHLDLLNTKKPNITDEEAAGRALKKLVSINGEIEELEQVGANLSEQVNNLGEAAGFIGTTSEKMSRALDRNSEAVGESIKKVYSDTRAIRKAVSK